MLDHTEQLADPMKRALELDAHDRDLTQRKLAELDTKIGTYMQLAKMESLYMIPPCLLYTSGHTPSLGQSRSCLSPLRRPGSPGIISPAAAAA